MKAGANANQTRYVPGLSHEMYIIAVGTACSVLSVGVRGISSPYLRTGADYVQGGRRQAGGDGGAICVPAADGQPRLAVIGRRLESNTASQTRKLDHICIS